MSTCVQFSCTHCLLLGKVRFEIKMLSIMLIDLGLNSDWRKGLLSVEQIKTNIVNSGLQVGIKHMVQNGSPKS